MHSPSGITYLFAVVLFFLFSSELIAQQNATLYGTVVSEGNAAPVGFATVQINNGQSGQEFVATLTADTKALQTSIDKPPECPL